MSADYFQLNRRGFIAGASAVVLPIALPSAALACQQHAPLLADWSIDDMWTGYPRPAQKLGYGRSSPRGKVGPVAAAQPGSIDVLFG